jgi:uncharacterized protein (TIGR03435 family)
MPDPSDMELLRDFNRSGSEDAFAALVQRHTNLVYSVAFRHVGIAAHAEEITQAVFIILARKAAGLRPDTILEGWLFETTRLTALSFLRGERRRQFREQEAYMQSTLQESTDASVWHQLSPLLDEAMARLGKTDRDAVILRFFKERSMREVAAAMQVSEAAAQRRVLRALEKLHRFFNRHGISSTTAIIAGAIAANSIQAAPVALAQSVTAMAAVKGAAASGSTLTLIKGALKIMAWTKAKMAIAIGVSILFVAGATTVTLKEIQKNEFDDTWRTQDVFTMFKKLDQVPPQVRILPSKFSPTKFRPEGGWLISHGKTMGVAVPVVGIVKAAYGCEYSDRVILTTSLPDGSYDFISNLTDGSQEALQRVLRQTFGVVAKWEVLETNALLLKVKIPDALGLSPTAKKQPPAEIYGTTSYGVVDKPLTNLVNFLESEAGLPVVDQTGLTGRYDFILKWNESRVQQRQGLPDSLREALISKLGLELVPGKAPVEMLVVGKTQ